MPVTIRMGGFKVLPAGRYEGIITNVEVAAAKKSDYSLLKFRVATENAEGKTHNLFCQYSFNPKASGFMRKLLKSLKVDFEETEEVADDGSKVKAFTFEPDDLAGRKVIAIVIVDKYEGNDQNKVTDLILVED